MLWFNAAPLQPPPWAVHQPAAGHGLWSPARCPALLRPRSFKCDAAQAGLRTGVHCLDDIVVIGVPVSGDAHLTVLLEGGERRGQLLPVDLIAIDRQPAF